MGNESKHYQTLQLFAFDTYKKHKESPQKYIDMKPQQIKKLKMITIADMASHSKVLDYEDLMRVLDIKDLRELEDLIIDCIYNELLKGQLDQKNKQLHVEHTYGRDMRNQDLDAMLNKLSQWDAQLEHTQHVIEKQIQDCNQNVLNNYEKQVQLELELCEKRDLMLKRITEGKEDENMGSGGPGLHLRKPGSKKGDPNASWGSGIMNSFKGGFFNK